MHDLPRDDAALFATVRGELFVAVVGDVLDTLGLQRQFLPPQVRPIAPDMVILGRAMPVLEADLADVPASLAEKPFGLMFEALDDLRAGEVYLCTGGSPTYALWGGLMSTRAIVCGAAGAVLHGWHRDTAEILRLGFPVASFGGYAQDQAPRGKVVAWREPVDIAGVRVVPGDIVSGDRDGALIMPSDVAEEAFARALEKVRSEDQVLRALQGGMRAGEAFATYGVM